MRNTRILVVSDRPVLRQGLVSIISAEPALHVVGQADSGTAAPQISTKCQPQIIIVDVYNQETFAKATLQTLCSHDTAVRIIILTSIQDGSSIKKFMEAGAYAVILINISTSELIETIRAVSSGKKWIDSRLVENLYFDLTPRLSDREVAVLACVARGHTNQTIGEFLGIAVNTVKVHLKNLFGKLGASNRTDAVMIAIKRGLLEP